MNQASCIICHKEYSYRGIFLHLLQSHDPQWKEEWRRKNDGNAAKGNASQTQNRNLKIKLYNDNPNKCYCGKSIPWEKKNNKFCSHSCSASFTNKARGKFSNELKQKISKSLKDYNESNKDYISYIRDSSKNICDVIFHKCTQCDNTIISIGKKPKRKTCSRQCQTHASVGNRSYKNGRRLNIYYSKKDGNIILLESSWEEKLAKYLDMSNIEWSRPKPISYVKDGINRLYYPDFFLPDYELYIDPKNPTALSMSLDKMKIVSDIIPIWYGDIDQIIIAIPLVRVAGFEPATRIFAPAPKAGGITRLSDTLTNDTTQSNLSGISDSNR